MHFQQNLSNLQKYYTILLTNLKKKVYIHYIQKLEPSFGLECKYHNMHSQIVSATRSDKKEHHTIYMVKYHKIKKITQPVMYTRMLLLSSDKRRLERGVLGGRRPVNTRIKFSTVT